MLGSGGIKHQLDWFYRYQRVTRDRRCRDRDPYMTFHLEVTLTRYATLDRRTASMTCINTIAIQLQNQRYTVYHYIKVNFDTWPQHRKDDL